MGSLLLITGMYCLIRSRGVLDPTFLVCAPIFLFIVAVLIQVLTSKAIEFSSISSKIIVLFRNSQSQESRVDYLFWKSCRPLRIKVASIGYIETYAFLLLLFESILKTTIDLILNF